MNSEDENDWILCSKI